MKIFVIQHDYTVEDDYGGRQWHSEIEGYFSSNEKAVIELNKKIAIYKTSIDEESEFYVREVEVL